MNKTGMPQSERPVDPNCPEISDRTLEQDIPELKEYLRPGAEVIDIGCGSGTITLDVAEAVRPGQVIGIDPNEERIDLAREWLTQHPYINNVSFQLGDSHSLDFPDAWILVLQAISLPSLIIKTRIAQINEWHKYPFILTMNPPPRPPSPPIVGICIHTGSAYCG